jgi:recombination protein RecA
MPNPTAAANGGEKDKAIASPSRSSPPAPSPSTSRSASAACPAAASSRSTARSPRARPPSPCTRWPNAQRNGGICAFIDAEHALDPEYAGHRRRHRRVLVSQPDTGEQALEIADMLIRSGALDIIVIDSVAALTPRAEIEGEMGDSHVGLQARLMSQALRKLTGATSTRPTPSASSSTSCARRSA